MKFLQVVTSASDCGRSYIRVNLSITLAVELKHYCVVFFSNHIQQTAVQPHTMVSVRETTLFSDRLLSWQS